MAERSLRGSRLGALSMETDANVVPSERNITTYLCPNGHTITLPFSVEADVERLGRRVAVGGARDHALAFTRST
jgi:hypothetical protein